MIVLVKRQAYRILEMIGDYVSLMFDCIVASFKKPPSWKLIREQLFHIGVMSLGVVSITGFTTGFVLAAQSFYQLGEKGLASVTGVLVGKSMLTELGPILTAFMVTGRVGSSMCAELGTMKVTEQIDALKSMAINPYAYLVAPRIIAGTFMIPLLTLFCVLMGIFGGFLIASNLFNMTATNYFAPMRIHITLFDFLSGVVKSTIFGILIVTVCCYRGMRTTGGAAGVGRSTTQSVVTSYVLILIADFFLTLVLNMIHQALKFDWMRG
ncbi:MAG: ABC transporter permease [Verrucomicrobia bacterium]|nr:ABC transporter permease [Verrucomicrobiota bacterium]MBU6446048.1 ABC transporter permease [Verrucomicrobiota bacterium]MDE3047919.1 ABC transporter permease [Verrucomicrobiota bacterium]